MRFQTPLVPARLIRRYKRFLADIRFEDGSEAVAHCPNPGAMLGLDGAGTRIWVEPNNDPRRKLRYCWRLSELGDGHWAGIDTGLPNRIIAEALGQKTIPELAAYDRIRPEVRYGQRSRVDFLLQGEGLPDLYLEVKNAHLARRRGLAEFPDCVTQRGARHLEELADMVAEGHRAMMLYLVQRTDCEAFALAEDLDPEYARAFERARGAGVEVLCYDTQISPLDVSIRALLPFSRAPASSEGR